MGASFASGRNPHVCRRLSDNTALASRYPCKFNAKVPIGMTFRCTHKVVMTPLPVDQGPATSLSRPQSKKLAQAKLQEWI